MNNACLLHQVLSEAARRSPDQTALIFREQSLSYREFDDLTNQMARTLITRGVVKGDRMRIFVSKPIVIDARGIYNREAFLKAGVRLLEIVVGPH